jgi:hypothetical protein
LSNSYFDWPARATADRFVRFDTVRAEDFNSALDLASAGFEKLPSPANLWGAAQNYAADTGAANAYVVSIAATHLTAYFNGLKVRFKAGATNTGASTINVNSLGAKAIVGPDGATALTAGQIVAGQMIECTYDGASFQMATPANVTWSNDPTAIQQGRYNGGLTTAGTSTAYRITPTPAHPAYVGDGTNFDVVFHAACGETPTFEVDSLGALQLGRQLADGTYATFRANEIPAGWRSKVRHVGTYFQLMNVPPILSVGSFASFRSKTRNGKMEIASRGTSFAAPASDSYTLDGWMWTASTGGVVTVSQQSDAPSDNEFQYSLRVAVTTADAAIAAGDFAVVRQPIEGFLVRDCIGRPVAIKFRVRSAKVGTHCVYLRNNGNDRSYVLTYTVSAANTWETKTVKLPAGLTTAGTTNWATGRGIDLGFVLAAGATYQTTADAWQAGNYFATAAQVNCLDTVGNIFAITGVQMENGNEPGPFEHRDPATEAALNQRYLWAYIPTAEAPFAMCAVNSTSNVYAIVHFPTEMRIPPSMSTNNVAQWKVIAGTASVATTGVAFNTTTKNCAEVIFSNSSAPFTVGNAGWVRSFDATARMYASAELT